MKSKKNAPKEAMTNITDSPEEQIRKRAYELYLARNGGPGSDVQDWLQAEAEIGRRVNH